MAKEWIVPDADLGCDGAYFDYQELVRCGECRYWDGFCDEVMDGRATDSEWYCAGGERKVQE